MNGIQSWAGETAVRLVVGLVRSMPPRCLPSLAWIAGTLWYLGDRRRRRRTAENLRVTFGDTLTVAARSRLAREVFRSMARVPLEVLWFERLLGSPRQLARRCTYHGDWPDARPAGVAWGGHLGNWELLARAVQPRLGRMRSVARRIKDPAVQAIITGVRGGGSEVIDKHGAYRTLVRTIRAGAWVGLVGDQNAGASGRFIPFFGLAASTHESPARLALREGVPLVVLAAIRRPGRDLGFDIHAEVLHAAGPQERDAAAIEPLLARMNTFLEGWARRHPEQYNFLHRRWKDRPPEESPGPHLPRYDHHRPRPGSPASPPSEA